MIFCLPRLSVPPVDCSEVGVAAETDPARNEGSATKRVTTHDRRITSLYACDIHNQRGRQMRERFAIFDAGGKGTMYICQLVSSLSATLIRLPLYI